MFGNLNSIREDIRFLTKLMTDFSGKVNGTLADHEDRLSKLERLTEDLRDVSNTTVHRVSRMARKEQLRDEQLDKLNRNLEELLRTAVIWEGRSQVGLDTKEFKAKMEGSGIPSTAALAELQHQSRLVPDCQGKLTRPVRVNKGRVARAVVIRKEDRNESSE